jgi:tetratricopeptide (TPR) repeat protein
MRRAPQPSRDAALLRALADRIDPLDPGATNNLGVLYYSKGLYVEAVEAFLAAVALAPRMRAAARNLELAARQEGACAPRLAALAGRIAANPGDVAARREQARLLRLIGRTAEARAALEALIAADPDDAVALHERGMLERQAGDLARAQRWLERAVTAAPDDVPARLHLAEVLYHRGFNAASLDALEALLAIEPDCGEAHRLRAFVLGDVGRAEEARRAMARATALDPSLLGGDGALAIDAGPVAPGGRGPGDGDVLGVVPDGTLARYGLGLAFRQRGYFAEARREFERARDAGEDARLVGHALAELALVTGDHAAARLAYAPLLAADPAHARLWNEAGVAYHQGGHVPDAMQRYRRALRVDPQYALAYNNLGVALAHAHDARGARDAFARAVELDPTLTVARLNLARALEEGGDRPAALAALRDATVAQPRHGGAWQALGRLLLAMGRPEEARHALVTAVERAPALAESRYLLGEVLTALGDHDGALRETQEALRRDPMRAEGRYALVIDLQRECPDAVGPVDLLAHRTGTPLDGTRLAPDALDRLLPGAPAARASAQPFTQASTLASAQESAPPADAPPVGWHRARPGSPAAIPALADGSVEDAVRRARARCEAGDRFAERGVHGEARERYAQARVLLAPWPGEGRAPAALAVATVRRHAILGEARSACLLGDGAALAQELGALADEAPDDAEIQALAAATHAALPGGRGRTRAALARVIALDPPSAALFHFAGDAALRAGEEDVAIRCYRRALALDGSRPSARVSLARVLAARGEHAAARLELVAALAAAPGWRDARVQLARLARDTGQPAEVVRLLRAHLAEDPTDCDALALLAEALVALRRHDEAGRVVDRLRLHAPDHPAAMLLEGWLLARRGHRLMATARWRRLLAVAPDGPEAVRARRWLDHFARRSAPPPSTTPRRDAAVAPVLAEQGA